MTEREAAEFIADHARELAQVARAAGLDVLRHILERAPTRRNPSSKPTAMGAGGVIARSEGTGLELPARQDRCWRAVVITAGNARAACALIR
jgi:hypothetical protein